jgi:hypothetical protein
VSAHALTVELVLGPIEIDQAVAKALKLSSCS